MSYADTITLPPNGYSPTHVNIRSWGDDGQENTGSNRLRYTKSTNSHDTRENITA